MSYPCCKNKIESDPICYQCADGYIDNALTEATDNLFHPRIIDGEIYTFICTLENHKHTIKHETCNPETREYIVETLNDWIQKYKDMRIPDFVAFLDR